MAVLLHETHLLEVDGETAASTPYPVVPIDVPQGAEELRVTYRVDGEARVDLGLVDPRGAGPGLPGFRGWSGSARRAITVGRSAATPGYVAGRVTAGRWGVLIGLYQVDGAARIEITVDVSDEEGRQPPDHGPPTLEGARRSPAPSPRRLGGMVAGDLHAHSVHSGDAPSPLPVSALVALAEEAGLSFLAVTDHNTVSHHGSLTALAGETSVHLLAGQEVTSYRGHFNAWGTSDVVDFRIRNDADLVAALASVSDAGGVASICHPKTIGPPWRLGVPDAVAAMEAWAGPWVWANGESLAAWDALLRRGRRLCAVGGSDLHDVTQHAGQGIATPATWIPEGEDPLTAVRARRVVVSTDASGPVALPLGPDGEVLLGGEVADGTPFHARVVGGAGGRLRVVGPGGPLAEADVDDADQTFDLGPLRAAWARLEVWGPGLFRSGPVAGRAGSLWALANPVWTR